MASGLADANGDLTGTADCDVFGAVRSSTGDSSVFGFTGEQLHAETYFTYLRARYLNPSLGRFLSADSVQPNAPGTPGYNPYAYVANNPTTSSDPNGHDASEVRPAVLPDLSPSLVLNWKNDPSRAFQTPKRPNG